MKTVPLKLQEEIFLEMEALLAQLKQNRNSYINEAVQHYNRLKKRLILAEQLQEESRLVAQTSLEVMAEMELIESIV